MLLTLCMVICIFPSIGGIENQVTSNKNVNIGLDENKILLNAAGSIQTIKKYKKTKKKYKKAKTTYKYKKVKVRYKYKGKWRTKWVYKKYKTVKATSKKTTKKDYSKYTVQGNPKISSDTVSADAKCSCNLYKDYNIHKGTWVNYCPYCGKQGTLSYTNQQGCPEGMFYCDMNKKGCDADYCIVHGKAHTNNNPKYLTPA
ncbi:hypothetical protein [Methanobacterium oryzae]|uniref:hypothetical protein n=1 Tax=Methanobacterium oryzae TaxID=69540 RepID=UPI003D19F29D